MPSSKNLFFILLLLNLVWALPSCGPKDCQDDGTCPPEYYRFTLGEAKDYLWAKPGSYWIYKNTLNGALDTQTCTYFYFDSTTVKGNYDHSKHIIITYDILKRKLYSTFNKWIYSEYTREHNPNATPFSTGRTVLMREVGGEGLISAFHTPFTIGTYSGTGSENTIYTGMDTTLTLQGKVFDRVVKFELDMDDIWYDNNHPLPTRYPNAVYYWAKNVGLIKRENKSEKYSWELIDYNIIK